MKLTRPYLSTLAVIGGNWTSTGTIAWHLRDSDVSRTALLNRLNRLASRGLVKRRRITGARGRSIEWRRP